jgi:hypothetical protein
VGLKFIHGHEDDTFGENEPNLDYFIICAEKNIERTKRI